jgi:hypothetical protein
MSESHARGRRRPPLWLWIAAGVLAVGVAAVVALLLGNRGGGPVPEAEVVTLPVPTPTVSAIAREAGTPFYDALPSEVLAFALSASADSQQMLAAGALEGYQLDYTDGSQQVVLQAGQWPTADEADAAYAAMLAAVVPEGASPDDTGAVEVDGSQVGTYATVTHEDGTSTVLWTNGTAVLELDGPADALPDLYTAFPL